MKVSDKILGIVQEFEGYAPIANHCSGDPKNIFTGGYGTICHPTGQPVKDGDVFSKSYALYCLEFEMDAKCVNLNKCLLQNSVILNQNQFDALASFIYNVGDGKLTKGTTMGDAIAADDIRLISNAFLAYTKGTAYIFGIPYKKVLPGLVARRKAERDLFLS
jgi:GH24 family phage-related lysozyme (muramidase)